MVRLWNRPFTLEACWGEFRPALSVKDGALASFAGLVRDTGANGRALAGLHLECYPEMTRRQLEHIGTRARARWDLGAFFIAHRYGATLVGDTLVVVLTAAGHREAALTACQAIIDQLKCDAPFWKQEIFTDGTRAWVPARPQDARAHERWQKATAKETAAEVHE